MSDVVKKFFKERHAKENRKQEKEKEREEAKQGIHSNKSLLSLTHTAALEGRGCLLVGPLQQRELGFYTPAPHQSMTKSHQEGRPTPTFQQLGDWPWPTG